MTLGEPASRRLGGDVADLFGATAGECAKPRCDRLRRYRVEQGRRAAATGGRRLLRECQYRADAGAELALIPVRRQRCVFPYADNENPTALYCVSVGR